MLKRWLALMLGLALLLAVGCKQSGTGETPGNNSSNTPVDGGTLNLSMFSAPKGVFNPILYEDEYDSNVIGLVFDGLLMLDEKLQWVCNLCETYTVSDDNKTVTFKLRSDVKWHDGQPLTTADVAFTFLSMLNPEYTGVRTGEYSALVGVEKMLEERDGVDAQLAEKKITDADAAKTKMEAWNAWLAGDGKKAVNIIDPQTISFSTDEPYAPFVQSLAMPILPEHVFKTTEISKLADNPATKKPIGTGPYKFDVYEKDQYVKLIRNENYHLGKPHIPTVIYKVANQQISIGQLIAGELDFVPIDPSDVPMVQANKDIKLYTRPDFGYQYMGINFDNEFLKDQRVRQAIVYGINRQAIVDNLLAGYGTVMNSHMPPALWAYDPGSLNAYPHDIAKAQQLLAEAGWTEKNADGYLTKDGKVLQFTLKYPTGNKVREDSAPLIQANLKEIGIDVELQSLEFTTLSTEVFDKRDMDAWLMGWSLTLDPDPGAIFLPDNKWGKVTGWTNARSEQLIKDGVRLLKVSDRKPIYVEWAKILNTELPYIFLYSQNVVDAVRQDRIMGLKPDARGTLWNIWELWIPQAEQG